MSDTSLPSPFVHLDFLIQTLGVFKQPVTFRTGQQFPGRFHFVVSWRSVMKGCLDAPPSERSKVFVERPHGWRLKDIADLPLAQGVNVLLKFTDCQTDIG